MHHIKKYSSLPPELDSVRTWASLPHDVRKRRVARAISNGDHEALFGFAIAYLALFGKKGGRVSQNTVSTYKTGFRHLFRGFETPESGTLLRPGADFAFDGGTNWAANYIRMMEANGSAAATVSVRLSAARCFYAALRWSGVTNADPFREVKAGKVPDCEFEGYTPDELELILASCKEPFTRLSILLGAEGGLRISEAVGLEWTKVDFIRRELNVLGKGRKKLAIPLSIPLEAELRRFRQYGHKSSRVLGGLRADALRKRLVKVVKGSGVMWRTFHGLRHACGAGIYQRTGSLGAVADFLGHTSLETAKRYAKRYPQLAEAIRDGITIKPTS